MLLRFFFPYNISSCFSTGVISKYLCVVGSWTELDRMSCWTFISCWTFCVLFTAGYCLFLHWFLFIYLFFPQNRSFAPSKKLFLSTYCFFNYFSIIVSHFVVGLSFPTLNEFSHSILVSRWQGIFVFICVCKSQKLFKITWYLVFPCDAFRIWKTTSCLRCKTLPAIWDKSFKSTLQDI